MVIFDSHVNLPEGIGMNMNMLDDTFHPLGFFEGNSVYFIVDHLLKDLKHVHKPGKTAVLGHTMTLLVIPPHQTHHISPLYPHGGGVFFFFFPEVS